MATIPVVMSLVCYLHPIAIGPRDHGPLRAEVKNEPFLVHSSLFQAFCYNDTKLTNTLPLTGYTLSQFFGSGGHDNRIVYPGYFRL